MQLTRSTAGHPYFSSSPGPRFRNAVTRPWLNKMFDVALTGQNESWHHAHLLITSVAWTSAGTSRLNVFGPVSARTWPSVREGKVRQPKRPTPKRILPDRAPSEDRADLRVRQGTTHLAGNDCTGHAQACHRGQVFGIARSLGAPGWASTEPRRRSELSDADSGPVCQPQ